MLKQVGKYQIIEKIGVGGFGAVYKGRDPFIKRLVAIKTCQSEEDEIKKRFFREAEFAGNLQHRNITTIYDFGLTEEGVPYIVQEFLTGEDLDKMIKRRDAIAVARKVAILMDVADGLGFAHAAGIIHRDIKPANVRILEDGTVKIMDFGIAKSMISQSTLTQTGITLGTASYLAPEQIRGEPVDPRTDIFSYGVMSYELLSGQKPFAGEHISTVLYKILHEMPPPPSALDPSVPPALDALVMSTIEKNRDNRPGSCAEIRDALRSLYDTLSGSQHVPPPAPLGAPLGAPVEPSLEVRPLTPSGGLVTPPKKAEPTPTSGRNLSLESARLQQGTGAPPSKSAVGDVRLRPEPTHSAAVAAPANAERGALRILIAAAVVLLLGGSVALWYFTLGPGRLSPEDLGGSSAKPTPPPPQPTPAAAETPGPTSHGASTASGGPGTSSAGPGHVATPAPSTGTAPVAAKATPVPPPPTPTPVPRGAHAQATPVAAAGSVVFSSNYPARLSVDGKPRGDVDVRGVRSELPPGKHRAVFQTAGLAAVERTFEVKGGDSQSIRVDFPPRGSIRVTINYEALGAEIFVDGSSVGKTEAGKRLEHILPSGAHKLEAVLPGFEPFFKDIDVPEGDVLAVSIVMRRRDS